MKQGLNRICLTTAAIAYEFYIQILVMTHALKNRL
uniref:Uncharacterized protein n=1 Tax=Ciona intestinalis TaxID=7719 RepID=H2XPY3_CIOIN